MSLIQLQKLYDKLLNTYTAQYNKLSEDQEKTINVPNRPKNLTLGFIEGDLPPMPPLEGDEETIVERIKLNTRRRKTIRIGLNILNLNKLLNGIY